jgi:hypothetical protein
MLGVCVIVHMKTTMKYDLPLLNFDTWISLWKVNMRAVLAHHDLDEALESFGNKDRKSWIVNEVRKDQKDLSMICPQLSNNVSHECLE